MPVKAHKFYKKNKGEIKITWEDVERDTLHIVRAMAKNKFKPDVIISYVTTPRKQYL